MRKQVFITAMLLTAILLTGFASADGTNCLVGSRMVPHPYLEEKYSVSTPQTMQAEKEYQDFIQWWDAVCDPSSSLYASFYIDTQNQDQIVVQTVDLATCKQADAMQMAAKYDWKYTIQTVSYSNKEIYDAIEKLEAVAEKHALGVIQPYEQINGILVQASDHSDKKVEALKQIAEIENLVITSGKINGVAPPQTK